MCQADKPWVTRFLTTFASLAFTMLSFKPCSDPLWNKFSRGKGDMNNGYECIWCLQCQALWSLCSGQRFASSDCWTADETRFADIQGISDEKKKKKRQKVSFTLKGANWNNVFHVWVENKCDWTYGYSEKSLSSGCQSLQIKKLVRNSKHVCPYVWNRSTGQPSLPFSRWQWPLESQPARQWSR